MKSMPKKPFLVLIDGPMGAGKSTTADVLHQLLPKTALVGQDRIKWFVSDFRRTAKEKVVTFAVLRAMIQTYLSHGTSVILEEGFKDAALRKSFVDIGLRMKARTRVYLIEAPRDILLKRISTRKKVRAAKAPVGKTRVLKNLRNYEKSKPKDAPVFDSSKYGADDIAQMVLKDIRNLK